MNVYCVYFCILLSIFLIVLFILFFYFFNFLFSFICISMDWSFINCLFNFNIVSSVFSVILFLIVVMVLFFSSFYMGRDIYFSYFLFMFFSFSLSMFLLSLSYSVFFMIVSWDLLGISSFFLVLYYNNWDSCSGSMNTVFTNRMGDFFLFIFFIFSLYAGLFFIVFLYFFVFILFLLLTAFTKSAQFPFSGWLPKAMSAPTPVSSLVHSSTLVTAGLFLFFNFTFMLLYNEYSSLLLFVGIFTVFMSGVSAVLEKDFKKIIALSTLSQIGFCVLVVGLGFSFLSFMHLISHALFKSCLFLLVGYIIYLLFGQQDCRSYFMFGVYNWFMQMQVLVCLFCLCGLFFSSGLVSKDFVLEFYFFNSNSFIFVLFFFFSVWLTFLYSYRVWFSFVSLFYSFMFYMVYSLIFFSCTLFLLCGSIMFLWWFFTNICLMPILFVVLLDLFMPFIMFFLFLFFMFLYYLYLFLFILYKFMSDYYSKFSVFLLLDFCFMDRGLGLFFMFFLEFFLFLRYFTFFLFFSKGFLFLFVFMVFWLLF